MSEHIKEGAIVKMNPWRVEIAWQEWGSAPFEGERKVFRTYLQGDGSELNVVEVESSNNWREEDLLFKGVDYN